ncbi:MAG: dihydrolipoyl dehydrogenase [Nitrospinota bacterium]|nr:dihydrolipoyl dehydrogenase [Nitrospinota bacterium]
MKSKKLLVLGAGPGGYAAAFMAADKGMDVTLVDSNPKPGGVCLHKGCIPSKTLLHLAKLIHKTREAKAWGLDFGTPGIDLEAMKQWKNEIIDKLSSGLTLLAKQRGVKWIQGHGIFKDSNSVEVSNGDRISFDQCILATGSSPFLPPGIPDNNPSIMDSTSALQLEKIPERLLVIGGGYIGLEMGTVYSALGSRVSVVEIMDSLLPGVDSDLVRPLSNKLKQEFENIHLNTTVAGLNGSSDGIKVDFQENEKRWEGNFESILVSAGRKPNTGGIGLEYTKVETGKLGRVKTDGQFRTADSAIMAIGDIVDGPQLAHKASQEGKRAVEILSGDTPGTAGAIPFVVFTDPEIAWCGISESEAKSTGLEISVAKYPWGASGRAQTLGRTEGMTKLVIDPKTERILGVGLVGAEVGELIAEGVLALKMGATVHDLADSIHPHPTLSETLMEAAEAYLGRSTHIYKKKR